MRFCDFTRSRRGAKTLRRDRIIGSRPVISSTLIAKQRTCNTWGALIYYSEPTPVKVTNGDALQR